MRKSSSSKNHHGWAGKIEYEVAAILVDLPHLFYEPSPAIAALLSSCSWGSKKRRSGNADDEKDDVVVVSNKTPSTTPPLDAISPSQSQHHNAPKPRRKSVSKKKTKEELLKKVDVLTECKDQLTREVGVVRDYRNKVQNVNSILKAALRKHQLQEAEEEISEMVTKRMRNADETEKEISEMVTKRKRNADETDAATDFPSPQHMSFMYPTHQSCQVLPPEARYSGYGGLNMSSNGIPVGCRAMDPSS